MQFRLIHQIPPTKGNPRNSEGSFLRGKQGELLFAYSRYHGESNHDHAACDVALITSTDEGESWSEERLIATADSFGTQNIMSVSAVEQQNGDLAFYFLIKENDFSTTIGRTVSSDGITWRSERCDCRFPKNYYVINNDRFVRLSDGRLVAPAAFYSTEDNRLHAPVPMKVTLLCSFDDGKSFARCGQVLEVTNAPAWHHGYLEPGIIEYPDRLYLWMRTNLGRQYESISTTGLDGFFDPRPSEFTSPDAPMQIKCLGGVTYAIYNPIPEYNGRNAVPKSWGRTPLVLRTSLDGGKSWGALQTLEEDPARGFCYPAITTTRDGCLLLAYCRGDAKDGNPLCRIGIAKVRMD